MKLGAQHRELLSGELVIAGDDRTTSSNSTSGKYWFILNLDKQNKRIEEYESLNCFFLVCCIELMFVLMYGNCNNYFIVVFERYLRLVLGIGILWYFQNLTGENL